MVRTCTNRDPALGVDNEGCLEGDCPWLRGEGERRLYTHLGEVVRVTDLTAGVL